MKHLIVIGLVAFALGGCTNVQTAWHKASPLERTSLGVGAGCLTGLAIGSATHTPHGVAVGTGIGCVAGGVAGALSR